MHLRSSSACSSCCRSFGFLFRSCFNLLFAIQMRNMLGTYGKCMRSLTLIESEFVHPQTLNPFALACKNIESLAIINPVVVSDELFVGEVPDLAITPFKSLKSLIFEGDTITGQVGRFLLQHSNHLESLQLSFSCCDAAAKGTCKL